MPSRIKKATPRERRVLDMFIKLMRAQGSLTGRLNLCARSFGLTGGQFGALEILLHLGPLHQKELGRRLFSTEGNITQIVDNLEKRELVRRVRDAEDRRFITVHLTAAGTKLIRRAFPAYLKELLGLSAGLTDRELEQLAGLLKQLGLTASSVSG